MTNYPRVTGGSQKPIAPSHLPSLALAFELAREQLADQRSQAAGLDTKASFVLGSASLLTAAATALHSMSASATPHPLLTTIALLAVFVYLVVVAASYQAYTLRVYKHVPNLERLQEYIGVELQQTKGTLLSTMVLAYGENQRTLAKKVRWTKTALFALAVEAVVLAVLTLMQTIH